MRIGIITFWSSNDNYGQLLQCWALQQVIRGMGHEPFLIKFKKKDGGKTPIWKRVAKVIAIYPVIRSLLTIAERRKNALLKQRIESRNVARNFDDFRDRYIVSTSHLYESLEELQANPPQADAYITGSDQVWAQLLYNKNNEAFFLNFGSSKTKRMSYAPSFSMMKYPAKLQSKLRKCLQRFDTISVREKAGLEICRDLGFNATIVCDPTLLLPKDSYLKIVGDDDNDVTPYIYVYCINVERKEELRWEELANYAKSEHLSIKVTPSSGYVFGREIFGKETEYDYCTIPKWLSNIAKAKFVVTPSFHGVVFSIIMHTPFVYIPLEGRFSGGNSRIFDLLEKLCLTNRIWNGDFMSMSNNGIDWKQVDNLWTAYKEESLAFLRNNLNQN